MNTNDTKLHNHSPSWVGRIAVIADDFTGAAEIGGLALRYGLSVEITTEIPVALTADVTVVSTDTRSMKEEQAISLTENVVQALMSLRPSFIYKKIDSVLRGHVVAEIETQILASKNNKALVVPCNPSLGRKIIDGLYYVNEVPVHHAGFAADPEFAIQNAEVLQMVRSKTSNISVQKTGTVISANTIVIGEAANTNDLMLWASETDDDTIAAGGGDFFMALLEVKGKVLKKENVEVSKTTNPALYISGTTFGKSVAAIKHTAINGGPVSYMPANILTDVKSPKEDYQQWALQIAQLLNTHGKAIIAIDNEAINVTGINPVTARERMGVIVQQVCNEVDVKELVIEGGATAAAIIEKLQLKQFYPVQEPGRGVVKMKTYNLYITVKPGSYNWPPGVWNF